jgi:hypothetical protein
VADPIPAPVVDTPTPPAVGFVDDAPWDDYGAPVPPDDSVWWDEESTVANVLAQLRFEQADVDVGRIRALVPVGGALVNQHLDRWEPLPEPVPAPVQAGLEQCVIELYRRKDSALVGSTSSYTSDAVAMRYGAADVLAEIAPQLTPWRQRWGFA